MDFRSQLYADILLQKSAFVKGFLNIYSKKEEFLLKNNSGNSGKVCSSFSKLADSQGRALSRAPQSAKTVAEGNPASEACSPPALQAVAALGDRLEGVKSPLCGRFLLLHSPRDSVARNSYRVFVLSEDMSKKFAPHSVRGRYPIIQHISILDSTPAPSS